MKYTLYNFYNNFLEALTVFILRYQTNIFIISSSFSYLLVSSYILEGKNSHYLC